MTLPDIETRTPEIYTPETFITTLNDRTIAWLRDDQGGEIVASANEGEIDPYEDYDGGSGRGYRSSLQINRALIFRDPKKISALVLGQVHGRYWKSDSQSFHFGFWPAMPKGYSLDDINSLLSLMLVPYFSSYHRGAFYAEELTDKIGIDSWPDGYPFGGSRMDSWKRADQLTERGMQEALRLIEQTAARAFSPQDLRTHIPQADSFFSPRN